MRGLTILGAVLLVSACGGGGNGPVAAAPVDLVAPVAGNPAPATSAPVATTEPTASAGVPAGYKLVWSDEFSGSGLPDAAKWGYDTARNQVGWYNNEKQYYAASRLQNSSGQNGQLSITAVKEQLTNAPDFGGQAYTSARLTTQGQASWTYGFFEVRAKLPCSLGTWPAIWMLGTKGTWPDDGEIDLMEQKGTSAANKGLVLGTIHTRGYNYFNGSLGLGQGASQQVSDTCTNFHSYQLLWDKTKVAIGVDNATYFTYLKPVAATNDTWPFDNPQYLILNLAMGGDLGGAIPASFSSDQMVVDYVRVYQQ